MTKDVNGGDRDSVEACTWLHGHERAVLRAVIAVAIVLLMLFCCLPAHRLVDYLSDDAYYYFKVARHMADGHGPTFDGITRTTGFHPLYAFVLAALRKAFSLGDDGLVRAALLLNASCFVATGGFVFMAVRHLWGTSAGRWGAIFWYANPNALLLVATGMEGSLYAFSVAAFFALLIVSRGSFAQGPAGYRGVAALGLLGGMCLLARTDALVLVALTAIYLVITPMLAWWRAGRFRMSRVPLLWPDIGNVAVFTTLALLPLAAWFLYARHYTGSFLQASAQMKQISRGYITETMTGFEQVAFSAGMLGTWIFKSIVKVPALKYVLPFSPALAAVLVAREAKKTTGLLHVFWLYPLMLGLAYSIMFPRTWTWYYAPGLVTLSILAAGGMAVVFHGRGAQRWHRYATRWLPLLLAVAAMESYGYLAIKGIRGRNRNQRDMYAVATWMERNLPADARVAAWNAGIYGWYSGRTVINLDGLINNEIAEVYHQSGSLSDYLRHHHVQYVVDDAVYMQKRIPEWTEQDYSVFHWHSSRHMGPIAVWRLR